MKIITLQQSERKTKSMSETNNFVYSEKSCETNVLDYSYEAKTHPICVLSQIEATRKNYYTIMYVQYTLK